MSKEIFLGYVILLAGVLIGLLLRGLWRSVKKAFEKLAWKNNIFWRLEQWLRRGWNKEEK